MDIIQLLPDHIANQIAAGEVIQRPASVVKEMVENSIDAGATKIEVIIKEGGKTLIQVVDNGCGMSNKDAKMSFERHATSKIKKPEDLFSIKSMGFRGEAMASIGAISHVELNTKLTNEELGCKIIFEGSEFKSQESCICANGSSIKIKNLFFNVPARRKFLKSDKVENKHIIEQFIRIALANSEISFSLKIDNNYVFKLEPSKFRQRIINIIGSKTNEKLVPVEEETNLVKISGFIGKPEYAKLTRGEQYFFVNGRFIKNYYLNHAIKKAFSDLIPENQHPSYFLNLSLDPKKIDINIHPNKTEIKFEDEKSIYAILRSSVKRSLGKYNIAPSIDFNIEPSFEIPINYKKTITEPKIRVNTSYNPFENKQKEVLDNHKIYDSISKNDIQKEVKLNSSKYFNFFQINNQYVVCNNEEGLIIIHQERAHHRILYEYFTKNSSQRFASQKLIFPKTIFFSKKEINEITEIKKELEDIGFQFKISKDSLEVNATPPQCDKENLQSLFEDVLKCKNEDYENLNEKISNKISKSISYNLSIKTGKKLNPKEMEILIDELMNCETPSVSPYGLNTFLNLKINEIQKKFSK